VILITTRLMASITISMEHVHTRQPVVMIFRYLQSAIGSVGMLFKHVIFFRINII